MASLAHRVKPARPRGSPAVLMVVGVLCLVLVLGASAIWAVTHGLRAWTLDQRREARIAAHQMRLPPIAVHDQLGQPLRLFGEVPAEGPAQGAPSVYLVDAIYTRCQTVCRALGAAFAQLSRQLEADGMTGRIGLISLSFDPRDTGADLAAYAREHGARPPQWRVAAPDAPAAMQALLREADIIAIPDGFGGFVHNGGLQVVDARGVVLGSFELEDFHAAYALAQRHALAGGAGR
ncbi:SCO family protein [Cupriavidus sp. 2KB_3]|uniref:SCO family protein n=1 Tax=Cupriavidus TaxID=106589 RepID=UPI0021CCC4F2|nr:SCO family protein [Cupriavidus campinensis]